MMNNTPKKENAAIELFSGFGNSDFRMKIGGTVALPHRSGIVFPRSLCCLEISLRDGSAVFVCADFFT